MTKTFPIPATTCVAISVVTKPQALFVNPSSLAPTMTANVMANEMITTRPTFVNIGSRFAISNPKAEKLMMKIRSRIVAAISIGLLYLGIGSAAIAGTLLPPGAQVFLDNNGLPLSAGCVYFYVPGSTNPKDTYTSAAQTTPNTNPVQLDAAGRAVIYGTGVYRQIVKAAPCGSTGLQIWDQITTDTASSVTIYAGASAGTPNSVTVTAPGFTGVDGQVINYISTNTNTGGATFNPSGFGAIQIVRDSSTGPGALTGGELVATNAVSLIYDATAGTFHILSPITWPNTSGLTVGTVIPVAGFNAPANSAFAYGQAVNRTTFSSLLAAFTSAQTGSISSGSPTITGLTDTSQFGRGQFVEAVGINASTTILSCTSTTCTMSSNASTTRTGTMTFFAYGNGDGSTTFNLPDYRGQGLVGRDNMGGTAGNVTQVAANLTTTNTSTTATVSSASNLTVGMFLVGNANITPGTTISVISGTTLTLSAAAIGTQSAIATRFSVFPDAQALGAGGGSPNTSIAQLNLPAVNLTPNTTSNVTVFARQSNGGFTPNQVPNTLYLDIIQGTGGGGTSSFTYPVNVGTVPLGGSNIPIPIVQPSKTVNWAVRLTP